MLFKPKLKVGFWQEELEACNKDIEALNLELQNFYYLGITALISRVFRADVTESTQIQKILNVKSKPQKLGS
jgi:hypothetical protein